MKIRIKVDGGPTITGALDDSRAARDFASLLPLQLTLTDYAATEKVGDLPRKLVTDGSPAGVAAEAGDISYYARGATSHCSTSRSGTPRGSFGWDGSSPASTCSESGAP